MFEPPSERFVPSGALIDRPAAPARAAPRGG
jgi:hypothetical protein